MRTGVGEESKVEANFPRLFYRFSSRPSEYTWKDCPRLVRCYAFTEACLIPTEMRLTGRWSLSTWKGSNEQEAEFLEPAWDILGPKPWLEVQQGIIRVPNCVQKFNLGDEQAEKHFEADRFGDHATGKDLGKFFFKGSDFKFNRRYDWGYPDKAQTFEGVEFSFNHMRGAGRWRNYIGKNGKKGGGKGRAEDKGAGGGDDAGEDLSEEEGLEPDQPTRSAVVPILGKRNGVDAAVAAALAGGASGRGGEK